jgi:hypothetical protein
MKKTQTGKQFRQPLGMLACAGILTLLSGCGGGSEGGPEFSPAPSPNPVTGAISDNSNDAPASADPASLARSTLDITSKLVVVSSIVNTMLRDHIDLVQAEDTAPRNIPQCASSPEGYDFETNQVSYRRINPGFMLPAGPSLHVALSQCVIEGLNVSGFIDITDIRTSGNPAGNGNWQVEAEVWLSPVQIRNNNGTIASLTDSYVHSASRVSNAVATRIEIDADPGAGIIGGLNAQHYGVPFTSDNDAINFQFRPFRIDTVEDLDSGEYRVEISDHAEGTSTLSRYTNGADDEVLLRIRTEADEPLLWISGRPVSYTQPPVSGAVTLEEACADCATLRLSVAGSGEAVLSVEQDGSVTSSLLDWSLLLSPPPPP